MKSFRECTRSFKTLLILATGTSAGLLSLATAHAELPDWVRNVEARGVLEAVFFRAMSLPGGDVMFRRPPSETRPALRELTNQQPKNADLYAVLAQEDEQALDFASAETNWKKFAGTSPNRPDAQLQLADFYHRRLRAADEVRVLSGVANTPADDSEKFVPTTGQQSWLAFTRIFAVIQKGEFPTDASVAQYRAWIKRYPSEESLYGKFLDYLISQKNFTAANDLIIEYQKRFPDDEIFAVKAKALVEFRQGSVQQGLAVYEKTFQPLWDPELVRSYFELLRQTQGLRKFLDQANAALSANPVDINATARVFYYYQQQGKLDAAQEAVTRLRLRKESAHSEWTSEELYVCARLLEEIHSYPEAARFYFALYNAKPEKAGAAEGQERALTGLTRLLLTSPESPIRFGTGELSMYRDIATMDQGPGYLNGILSLLLNSTSPGSEYSAEEQKAAPYFRRTRAAELLTLLDTKFPQSAERSELHAKLLAYYASVGESEAVIKGGKEFLSTFPSSGQRTEIALLMADAYARAGNSQEEFAIYDAVLRELAAGAQGMPLGAGSVPRETYSRQHEDDEQGNPQASAADGDGARDVSASQTNAFQVNQRQAGAQTVARSPEYARVLERYLARLVEMKQVPQAIGVLRNEIAANPNDPGLYERLATFLQQNRLGAEQEDIYKKAIARFPDRTWYHKLARYYLRRKQEASFEDLTKQVVRLFEGTDLEQYFQGIAIDGSPALYVRVNLYANARFPHNPVFVNNLLAAYQWRQTYNPAAWEALLRKHWFEERGLRSEFFEFLARTGKLEAELSEVKRNSVTNSLTEEWVAKNPAAGEFVAQAELWRSHFEASAPVWKALAAQYPADAEIGDTTASVFRSLAYFDSSATDTAVRAEENLLAANPGNTAMLAKVGDTYADRELFAKAAPYWERIPQVAPGEAGGYLEAATIYWDYFDFDNALRLLNEARRKSSNDSLYAYEEGAIYEGKRDYTRAIAEYTKGAVAAGPESSAGQRLLELARRPKYRDLVDRETATRVADSSAPMAAIRLRVSALQTLGRTKELTELLDPAVARAATIEQAAELEALAQQISLENIREHAIERQATLTSDPVTRLQLRYSLARIYEERKDMIAAQRSYEALYRENPKILGVVRSTVDFYWRAKLYPQAIGVLQQASKDAYPSLSAQFLFEAARKATDAKMYTQAREFLAPLLRATPYDSQYIAAAADAYALEGDSAGLKRFYLDEIESARNAPMSADGRKAMLATLRRGLIPALTQLKEYSGAVDQYVEIINAFPEDVALANEATQYAADRGRKSQLEDYYAKTIQQSSRDFRWPMVLARVQTALEEYPAAIESYGKAITIRPDRVDLRTERASLSERLMRFNEAAADYAKLYELAYKDPQWMEKVAEIRARQGRTDDAVDALKTALIDGRPERPGKYFDAAKQLERWGMLSQAQLFAEQGVSAASGELLASTENHAGALTYSRIMTRLRRQEEAYAKLSDALNAAATTAPVLEKQVAKEGIAAVTDQEWRERVAQTRRDNAAAGMKASLTEMGATVARYFTPEEKVAFVQFAEKMRGSLTVEEVDQFAGPMVEAAGLGELEAKWLVEQLMTRMLDEPQFQGMLQRYADLQRRRLRFAELAAQMERLAPRVGGTRGISAQRIAAEAYRSADDPENELRVLESISHIHMSRELRVRFLQLLLVRRPQELVQITSGWNWWGQEAADFAVANGDAVLVHQVIAARGAARPPAWTTSYNALSGLYFSETGPAIGENFIDALGDKTIGERIGKPVNRDTQLAGDIWFYYGARYGEYLAISKQDNPEDFATAVLEQTPASSAGYLQVADFYADQGALRSAIADYNHVLELAPSNVSAHDRLALAYFRQGARAEALAQWKTGLSLLTKQLASSGAPESFWGDFGNVCDHLGSRQLFAQVRPEADALVREYLKRNGTYRSNAVLRSVYIAMHDPAAGVAWILDVSASAVDQGAVLQDLVDVTWIPLEHREPLVTAVLKTTRTKAETTEGLLKESAEQDWRAWQVRGAKYLIEIRNYSAAMDLIESIPETDRLTLSREVVPLQLRAAAKLGTLDDTLASYRSDLAKAPAAEALRAAAVQLAATGDKEAARKVLEFAFAREIGEHRLVAANFLGLAELRLAQADTPGALELLRRLVTVVGAPFENLDSAAALLEKTGHPAEAIEFLEQLVKANPWDATYRVRLAKARIASGKDADTGRDALVRIASDPASPYATRVEAASALASSRPSANLGSEELALLALGEKRVALISADKPFFYDARLVAARNTPDAGERIKLLANALSDTPIRSDAQTPLFHAAAGAHRDALAATLLDSWIGVTITANDPARSAAAQEEIIRERLAAVRHGQAYGEDDEDADAPESAAGQATQSQQAALAFTGGELLARLARWNDALRYLDFARRLEKDPQRLKAIAAKTNEVRAKLRVQQQNAARRPVLHEALEQDRLVRPRIVQKPLPSSAQKKGAGA